MFAGKAAAGQLPKIWGPGAGKVAARYHVIGEELLSEALGPGGHDASPPIHQPDKREPQGGVSSCGLSRHKMQG